LKTLIELFDECQLENIIAALSFEPQKIVFVGFSETMKEPPIENLKKFFKMRGLNVKIECELVGRYNFDGICESLNRIIDRCDDCCFDLTGGKELVLVAMGAVSEARNVPMIQFDIKKKKLVRVKNAQTVAEPKKIALPIEQSVVLNGGSIVDKSNGQKWKLDDEFVADVKTMWSIAKKDCTNWNKYITRFESIESAGQYSEPELKVFASVKELKKKGCYEVIEQKFFAELIKAGLITDYSISGDFVTFGYKNEQIRACTQLAGVVLELYTYITANEIRKENPNYATSIDMSVRVDWDGIIHESGDSVSDTRNEIDVVMMRGIVPVFISCKNGEVDKTALYELYTVAECFGGEYAKKVIITTRISASPVKRNHIIQRARDMGIQIIYDSHRMTEKQFKEAMSTRI